ncbi:SPFH domain-containing protein [Paenibacillus chartarius]|uniref:SPFH domain-containing protein n=1 Tax=Paenibacillus chartarius TaxID=747481 RepID=A0ABV6DFB3_9BACL
MRENKAYALNGFIAMLAFILLLLTGILGFVMQSFLLAIPSLVAAILIVSSIAVVQPNEALALTFFGEYKGTVRDSGIWMVTPFTVRKKISLKVRNFNSAKLKVNDVEGNPIEIAAVVVFRVVDSAKALYEVDDYETFVEIQSEAALRHVASKYPYDAYDTDEISLRSHADFVATELTRELQYRLETAGVQVVEARLTHLAYSTEIASAMLQRQQATAILAARQKIVEGAVGMVEQALAQLQEHNIVELDDERKAAMINNLMVAIVSDRAASPIINAGSLY